MEIKNFDKKLELNKITITNLKDTVMKNALGGNQWDTAPGKGTCASNCECTGSGCW